MGPRPGTALSTALVALTLTTGMVEAVSFLVLGPVFTAVQTGNLLLLGFAVAGQGGLSPAASAVSLGGFAAGASLGARFLPAAGPHARRWFPAALCAEAVLLGLAAFLARGLAPHGPDPTGAHLAVTATVAVAMGLRNATTLRAQVPDLSTTVATRSLTALLAPPPLGAPAGRAAQLRRTAAVTAMFAGGLLGAWLLRESAGPSAVLLAVAVAVLGVAVGHGFADRGAGGSSGNGPDDRPGDRSGGSSGGGQGAGGPSGNGPGDRPGDRSDGPPGNSPGGRPGEGPGSGPEHPRALGPSPGPADNRVPPSPPPG